VETRELNNLARKMMREIDSDHDKKIKSRELLAWERKCGGDFLDWIEAYKSRLLAGIRQELVRTEHHESNEYRVRCPTTAKLMLTLYLNTPPLSYLLS